MKKYPFSRSLVGIALLALLSAGAVAAEKITLKLAHNLERSHVVHQAFEEMSKEVNQLSDGKMKDPVQAALLAKFEAAAE